MFNDFLMFTTTNKPLASINLQFLFDKKSSITLKMYRKVGSVLNSVKKSGLFSEYRVKLLTYFCFLSANISQGNGSRAG